MGRLVDWMKPACFRRSRESDESLGGDDAGTEVQSSGNEASPSVVGDIGQDEAVTEHLSPEHPLYWTEAMCYPSEISGGEMSWDEVDTVATFLARLSLSLGERGALLSADALRALADDLSPMKTAAILSEPWMVPVKVKASDAVVLGRAVAGQALSEFGFDTLFGAGLAGHPEFRTEAGFKSGVFAGDMAVLKALAEALARIHTPLACTMATSIDYALACMGDRGAMARVADRLEALAGVGTPESPLRSGTVADGITLAADTWRRLSVARVKGRSDGVDLMSREIAPLRINLRRPWEIRIDGLSMPPPSPEAAAAMVRNPRGPHVRAEGRRAPVPELPDDIAEALLSEDSPKATGDGAARHPSFVTVLDEIAGGGSAEATWGHLLEPLPVIRPPGPDLLYEALRREMPWMNEANETAALAAAVAERHPEGCFRLPPILLVGLQGVGKSRWARRLSEISCVPMHAASLAGAASSKSVIGSERGWASARPSLPAIAFSSTRTANPILLVDEVDKTESGLNGDAISALLPMIEKETARLYPDIYLLGSLDLTRVSFVFTANSLSGLPQTFLDRVMVVNVPRPGPREFPSIAAAMAEEALSGYLMEGEEGEAARALARKEALSVLETGGSLRMAAQAAQTSASRSLWSPKEGLRLVT